eukprot:NODE_4966_length_736_cov_115.737991_g4609_i0.p1 GENE.NODE_4966_length_736_cov_115.737991_g4609_i0~~NODE_4966_length_736_cov_115.737991_g4609_i0.p1  ORF type:complete len:176 (+),score=15.03 NODE_4966_length_736_cov_115.737991_g4609_i0:92-619(+)
MSQNGPQSVPSHRSLPCMHQVRPGLFIGSQVAALDKELLQSNGITHILSMNMLRPRFPETFSYEVKATADEDRKNLLKSIPSNIQFIERGLAQGGAVLVHCQRGVNRSGSMVTAYLMHAEGLSYEAALNEVRKARACILPRPGMVAQLRTWEEQRSHLPRVPRRLHVPSGRGGRK